MHECWWVGGWGGGMDGSVENAWWEGGDQEGEMGGRTVAGGLC